MGVVEEAVEDGVAEGGIADDIVPVLDGHLVGEQGAAAGVAVVEDLEKVMPPLSGEGGEAPVVEDEEPGSGEPLDELGVAAVAAGEGEFVEEPREAVVAGGDAVAAGLVAEGAGEVGLAGSGGAGDEDGLAVPDPLSGGEAEHEGAVEAAGGLEVEVFDGGVEVQPSVALEPLVAALLPVGLLAFEQERETVLEGEFGDVGHGGLLLERPCHAGEPEFVEQVESGLAKHDGQDSFRVGKVYIQTVLDCFSRYVWARLYTSQMPVTAVQILNNHVPPFFEEHGVKVETILSDNGREYCGPEDRHPYELFLQLEEIEHRKAKVGRPQSKGFIERFHRTLLDEHLRVKGRTTWYESVEEMQADLDAYLETYNRNRPHRGRSMQGRTPYQVFKKGIRKPKSRKKSTGKGVNTAA